MGIEPDHLLYKMTFADYQIKLFYHNKRRYEESKNRMEEQRYIAYHLMLPHLDLRKKVPAIKDLIPLPWELEQVKKPRRPSKKQIAKQLAENTRIYEAHRRFFEMQAKKYNA